MKQHTLIMMVALTIIALSCSCGSDDTVVDTDPSFTHITDSWIPQVFSLDMSNYWQAQGITHDGKNYYLLPKPAGGTAYSQRFNPASKYFQSWVGIYTVSDNDGKTYGISDGVLDKDAVIKLGIADQTGWLRDFAKIPAPRVLLDETVPVTSEVVTVDGEPGWKLSCRLITQADVGDGNYQSNIPEHLIVPATCWNNAIQSYQEIMMNIVFYVWYSPDNAELNMIYLSSAEYSDLTGTTHNYLPQLLPELEKIARGITVRQK